MLTFKIRQVVPFSNGESLHQALHRRGLAFEPLWAEDRGHNNMPEEECLRHVGRFLQSLPAPTLLAGADFGQALTDDETAAGAVPAKELDE